jgi:hypothetical protein
MKALKWIAIGLVVLVAAVLIGLAAFLGQTVKSAIETAGPRLIGVPVTLDACQARLLKGELTLRNLSIGNPKGFDSPEAIRLDRLLVKIAWPSLLKSPLVIDRILVESPEINYELGKGKSNIGLILANLEGTKPPAQSAPEPAAPVKRGKSVIIKELTIASARFTVGIQGTGGAVIPMPLPNIQLTGIGESAGGVTPAEALQAVFRALSRETAGAAEGAGPILGAGADAVDKGAQDVSRVLKSFDKLLSRPEKK